MTGDAAYLLPNAVCATCGGETRGRAGGAFHDRCARDETGRLIVVKAEGTDASSSTYGTGAETDTTQT